LPLQQSNQVHDETLDYLLVGAHQAIELRAIWQGRKGALQRGRCVAVEVPLARETAPPSEDGQGDDLACTKRCLRAWLLRWRMGVAEVVHHNVKCGEEGVHIDHEESVPFPLGSGSKPTLANGHLPLKYSPDNSHQAFKDLEIRLEAYLTEWREQLGIQQEAGIARDEQPTVASGQKENRR